MVRLRAENFVSYRIAADQRGVASAALQALAAESVVGRPASVLNDLRARRTVLAWSTALDEADELFDARRFEEALAAYERLSLRLLALINPNVGPLHHPIRWLDGPEISGVMVEAAAGLLGHILPDQVETPQVFVERPELVTIAALGGAAPVAVRSVSDLPEGVIETAAKAASALEQGDWKASAALYEKALDATPENLGKVRADLLLNIAALEVQGGSTRDGLARLEQAQAIYTEIEDELGVAEVLHNRGLTQLRSGKVEDARKTLAEARKAAEAVTLRGLLNEAPDASRPEGGTGGGSDPTGGVPSGGPVRRLTVATELRRAADARALLGLRDSITRSPVLTGGVLGTPPRRSEPVDAEDVAETIGSDDLVLRMRSIGHGSRLPVIKLDTPAQGKMEAFTRVIDLIADDGSASLTWSPTKPIDPGKLGTILKKRVALDDFHRIGFRDRETARIAAELPQLYGLTLPIKMGDCLNRLRRFAAAHEQYERASKYSLINTVLEAPDLWRRMAENVVEWGDSLYQEELADEARPVYQLLMTPTFKKSDSVFYTADSLSGTGTQVAAWLDAIRTEAEPPDLSPALAHVLLTVRKRWTYLEAGLDFYGTPPGFVTPFSFRYLQDVARYLAQRASQAEQRYVEYYSRYESGQMSRLDLQATVQQAQLGIELASYNEQSARRTAQAAAAASDLADLRAQNAKDQLDEFRDVAWELESLAGHIARGSAWTGGDLPNLHYSAGGRYDIEGSKHEVLQELTKRQTEISNDLQASRMVDAVAELNQARAIATAQEAAAQARAQGAAIESQIARARRQHAGEMLDAFNEQQFNPEQWLAMANLMQTLALSALDQATDVARLMERAYNFENFDDRDVIRTSYRATTAGNLLGAEILLSDVDSFTQYHVSQVKEKPIPVKWGLSLAEEYPGQFLGLQNSGAMAFEVDLARLAMSHPGTYRHRLVAAELEVDGFVPPTGLRGRLTNSGLGRYRDVDGASQLRLQPAETLVLSRYSRRDDSLLLSPPPEMRGLFEGNSVASGWTLELPAANNDVDLHLIFDLRLVLYFDCLFDHDLFAQDSAPAPGVTFSRSRALHLVQHAPDAYFQLRETGIAELELAATDFPYNQRDPVLTSLALGTVSEQQGAPLSGVELSVTYPGRSTPVKVTLDAQGAVPSDELPVQAGTSALGPYRVALADDDLARRDDVGDLILVLGYEYTPA